GAGFGMTGGLKIPNFLAGFRIQAVELAVEILVESLADIEPAVGEARGRKDRLHVAAVVEFPQPFSRGPVQTIDGAEGRKPGLMESADEDSFAFYQGRR